MAFENTRWKVEGVKDDKLNARIRDNMNALKAPPTDKGFSDSTSISSSSTSFVNVDTEFNLSITTSGGDVLVWFFGRPIGSYAFDFTFNGSRQGGVDGLIKGDLSGGSSVYPASFYWIVQNVAEGTQLINLQWKTFGALVSIDSNAGFFFHAREVS